MQATDKPTQTGAVARTDAPAPGLSAFILARRYMAALRAVNAADLRNLRAPDAATADAADRAMKRAERRARRLQESIFEVPAHDLADAAAQIGQAMLLVEDLELHDLEREESAPILRDIARVLAGMLPVVAEAAGVSLPEIAQPWVIEGRQREFPDPNAPPKLPADWRARRDRHDDPAGGSHVCVLPCCPCPDPCRYMRVAEAQSRSGWPPTAEATDPAA